MLPPEVLEQKGTEESEKETEQCRRTQGEIREYRKVRKEEYLFTEDDSLYPRPN